MAVRLMPASRSQRILAARFAIVSREQFGPCRTAFDSCASGISDRVKDGRGANLVEVAALAGDTARATILDAFMGGQSLTATELAYCANVSRSTASGYLSKLVAARLLTVVRERRFSYYRIASTLVATMLETIKVVAAIEAPPRRQQTTMHSVARSAARASPPHIAMASSTSASSKAAASAAGRCVPSVDLMSGSSISGHENKKRT